MSSAADRCAVCGGEFSAVRIHIGGLPYHRGCAMMSYPPHTHEDNQRLGEELWRTQQTLKRVRAALRAKRTKPIK